MGRRFVSLLVVYDVATYALFGFVDQEAIGA